MSKVAKMLAARGLVLDVVDLEAVRAGWVRFGIALQFHGAAAPGCFDTPAPSEVQ